MSALFAMLVMLTTAAPPAPAPLDVARDRLKPCPASSEQPSGAMCGEISVPENRAAKGGRQIALAIVILPGRSATAKSDPVFGLAAGPGIASTRLAISYSRLYDMLQNDHDIVLVDQRGSGGSNPLFCAPTDPGKFAAYLLSSPPDDTALAACRDRLAKTADLKQYTTAAAVDDLEAVRQAFGYAKINLLAVDYGTRLALEYLRKYPAQVRAIALSGVYSPAYRVGVDGPRETQQSLDAVIARCAADPSCKEAFPNLAAEYRAVQATLDKGPVTAMLPIAENQPPAKVTLTKEAFSRALTQVLQWREDIQALPLAVHSAAGGDYMPFAALWLQRELVRNQAADGMALSVLCSEGAASKFLTRACAVWPHAAYVAKPPVQGATPALLISGALDPLTPPSYAAEVAKGLTNNAQVVFTHASHVPANPCIHGIITAFLKAGNSNGLATGCVAAFPPLKFLTAIPKGL